MIEETHTKINQASNAIIIVCILIGDTFVATAKRMYVRNIDFLKHCVKCLQPLIMTQDQDNVIITQQNKNANEKILSPEK